VSNAPNSPNVLALSGTGTAASVTLSSSPSSLSFTNVNAGTSSSKAVTVTNTGNTSVNVSQITVNAKNFAVSGMTMPVTLGAGKSASMNVSFSPTASENVTGNITVATSQGTTDVIPVSGTGVQPALTMTPSSASFGNVTVGSPSTQPIQITNSGTGTLTVTQVGVAGTGFTTGTLALPLSLNAGQSTNLSVQFAPTSAGADSGSVTIVSNAPNSPAVVALSGTGVAATQTLTFSTTSLGFGNVNAGSSSTQNVTLTNSGNASVTVSSVTESGAGFTLSGAGAPVTLTAGQAMTFGVIFSPTAAGSDTGTVTVTSTATGSPKTIALSGTGVQATTHSVTLNWVASTSTVSGYNVYRSTTNGSGYSKINSGLVDAVTYTDTTVQSGTTYYYVTTAVDSSGDESADSNQATAVVP
jgi:Abnormal spindle-like microcephaly-assoc'd, ASPM-SPD-2-Hydin